MSHPISTQTDQQDFQDLLRNSSPLHRLILDTIMAGVVVIDADTRIIVDINRYAADLIGLPVENIIGHECHKFICSAERGKCPVIDLHEHVDHSERTLLTSNGETIDILKTVQEMHWKGHRYILGCFLDIRYKKWQEERMACQLEALCRFNEQIGSSQKVIS